MSSIFQKRSTVGNMPGVIIRSFIYCNVELNQTKVNLIILLLQLKKDL